MNRSFLRPWNRPRIPLAVVLISLAAFACKPVAQKPGTPDRPPIPPAEAGTVLPGPLSEPMAAEALFGNGGGRTAMALFRPKRLWQVGGPKFEDSTIFACSEVNLLPFEEGEGVRAYLIAQARPEGHNCASCAPIVGALAVTEVDRGWRVDTADPELGTWGEKGDLNGTAVAIKLGKSTHGLLLQPSSQTEKGTVGSFILFAEMNGRFKEVIRLDESAVNNRGTCGEGGGKPACFGWETHYETSWVKGKKVPNLDLETSGTRLNPATLQPEEFSEKRSYSWNGSGYDLVTGGQNEEK